MRTDLHMKKYDYPILNIGDDDSFSLQYSTYFTILDIFSLIKVYYVSKTISKRLNLRLTISFDLLDIKNTAIRVHFISTKPALIPIRRMHTFIKFLIPPADRQQILDSGIN